MKIIIVTQNAPMYLSSFLNDLCFKISQSEHRINGILSLSPLSNNNVSHEFMRRFNYYGPIDFIFMSYHILKNILLSKISSRYPAIGCYSINNIADKYNIDLLYFKSVNSTDFINYVEVNSIDLIISIASPERFKDSILAAPNKCCINYHTGLLPKYRGRQPLFWAMLHNEKEVGISVHVMDKKLDNGPILVQRKITISPEDSLHSLYLKTIKIGPQLLIDAINILNDDKPDRIDNDFTKAEYLSFPNNKDAQLFRKRGMRFI